MSDQVSYPYGIVGLGRDSVVRTAACYGLGDQGTESRWWRDFPPPTRLVLRSTQPLYNAYRVIARCKVAGGDVDYRPTSSAFVSCSMVNVTSHNSWHNYRRVPYNL